MLVVQESDKDCPDASQSGGTLTFSFDNPVLLSDIGIMDADESDQRMRVTYADGVAETFTYSSFGDNSVQRVLASKLNVKKVEVVFPGSGAITEINFCPECIPQARQDNEHHCLIAGQEIMKAEKQIAFDDFENPDEHLALEGWKDGEIDNAKPDNYTTFNYTTFLGSTKASHKTFAVPWKAEAIIFELDFYTLDSWDIGLDTEIFVDGEQLGLANLFSRYDAHLEGKTTNGIKWVRDSSKTTDNRIHHFMIEVPKTTRMFDDGMLRLLLNAEEPDGVEKKTAGWDNVKVTARYGCAEGRSCIDVPSKLEMFEDFEDSNAGYGWSTATVEDGDTYKFTKFLGRYGATNSSTEKTYKVPPTAQIIILEVDFYQIDGWGKYDM